MAAQRMQAAERSPLGALLEAVALRNLGRVDEALAAGRRALALAPDASDWRLLAVLHADAGFAEEALDFSRHAVAGDPKNLHSRSRELFFSNFSETLRAQDVFEHHCAYGALLEQLVAPTYAGRWNGAPDSQRTLRVGFVSPDLSRHPVGMFLLPLLERIDRSRFQVVCYSGVEHPDEATRQIRAASANFVDARTMTDAQLSARIHADAIDVLIDLAGHSSVPRLGVFAEQPAPVQMTWLGYLNTTGLTRIGYRICDALTDPAATQARHTETLLALPHSQWCYRPFVDAPPGSQAPCLANGFVTFGSFNNSRKITDAMCARWARMMVRCPDSRLVLADVGSRAKKEAITAVFAREGVVAERLSFPPRADLLTYYRLFDRVDIALDTYPYGGGTTTLDALWMGVPVFALAGELPVSRSAASILQTLGLPEWIANSPQEYVEHGVARASDPSALAALRAQLRERLRNSAFMDEGAYARDFENMLRTAWMKFCAHGSVSAAVKVNWKARGNAALQGWDLNSAEECYRQAVLQEPEDAGARVNLSFVLLEKDQVAEAIDHLVRALALLRPGDDGVHDAHFLMGRALSKQGHVDEALASFEAAVAAKADFVEAMEEAARVLHEAGRYEEVLAWARRLQGVRPSAAADWPVK